VLFFEGADFSDFSNFSNLAGSYFLANFFGAPLFLSGAAFLKELFLALFFSDSTTSSLRQVVVVGRPSDLKFFFGLLKRSTFAGRSDFSNRSAFGCRSARNGFDGRSARSFFSKYSFEARKGFSLRSALSGVLSGCAGRSSYFGFAGAAPRNERTGFAPLSSSVRRPPPSVRFLKLPTCPRRNPPRSPRSRLPRSFLPGFSASTITGIPDGSFAPV